MGIKAVCQSNVRYMCGDQNVRRWRWPIEKSGIPKEAVSVRWCRRYLRSLIRSIANHWHAGNGMSSWRDGDDGSVKAEEIRFDQGSSIEGRRRDIRWW